MAAGLGCTVIPGSARHHLLPGVKLLAVPDLQLRMPVHLMRRLGYESPLVDRFITLLGAAKSPMAARRMPRSTRAAA